MRSDQARLSLFTAASFAMLGVFIPFWPAWLEARGLTTLQIGSIGMAWAWTRGIASPVWAHFADQSGRRKVWIVSLAFGALLTFAPFVALHSFAALLALTVLFHVLHAAVLPLGENMLVLLARERGLSYGGIRLWGSIAFIVASGISGVLLDGGHAERAYPLLLVALALGAAVALTLPDTTPNANAPRHRLPILEVLKRPAFAAMLAGSGIVQASHATYYMFSTLHWQAAGHSTTAIGGLWAEGVVAEALFFAAARRLHRRFDERALMLVAVLAGVVRWSALASSTDMRVLVGVQWLHGLSFAAAHFATMSFIGRAVPREQSASAMSVYGTINIAAHGLILAGVTPLFAAAGGVAFWPMTGVALLGGSIAVWGMRKAPAQA
ncbi:MAG: MFS transporter [Gemmatimonadaceae bacterium]|nr:MFS transporter [Gemmatimonadaceae bacterium]